MNIASVPASASNNASKPAAGRAPYLSFQLGGLEYGVDASKVKELRMPHSLERFATDGTIISGVAAASGVIMPIVDMRAAVAGALMPLTRTKSGAAANDGAGVIDVIVLALSTSVMGMVVDGVTDVVWLAPADIRAIPGADTVDYLIGLGACAGRRLILVDIDKLMSIRSSAVQAA